MNNSQQKLTTIKTIAENLFKKMGIAVKAECKSQEADSPHKAEPYLLKIHPQKESDAGLMIGWHGETLIALQHLLRLLVKKEFDEPINLVLDIGDYRTKQEAGLKKITETAASQVARTGKPVVLHPMPPFERRIVHVIVSQKEGIKSESIGEGEARRVMISPEKTA